MEWGNMTKNLITDVGKKDSFNPVNTEEEDKYIF